MRIHLALNTSDADAYFLTVSSSLKSQCHDWWLANSLFIGVEWCYTCARMQQCAKLSSLMARLFCTVPWGGLLPIRSETTIANNFHWSIHLWNQTATSTAHRSDHPSTALLIDDCMRRKSSIIRAFKATFRCRHISQTYFTFCWCWSIRFGRAFPPQQFQ